MIMKNPVVDAWYADPESRVYGDNVYMYVTNSLRFEDQHNLDLVTTMDLENFEVYHNILDMSTYNGASYAIWAPTVIDKNGKYYIIFAANNILSENEIGGLYIGVCGEGLHITLEGILVNASVISAEREYVLYDISGIVFGGGGSAVNALRRNTVNVAGKGVFGCVIYQNQMDLLARADVDLGKLLIYGDGVLVSDVDTGNTVRVDLVAERIVSASEIAAENGTASTAGNGGRHGKPSFDGIGKLRESMRHLPHGSGLICTEGHSLEVGVCHRLSCLGGCGNWHYSKSAQKSEQGKQNAQKAKRPFFHLNLYPFRL